MTGQLRHMLRDDDISHDEQKTILKLGLAFQKNRFLARPFEGPQGVSIIFDKPSTRTRASFSTGVAELGGYPLVIDKNGSQLGRGEPVADTTRVLTRMTSALVWRTFGQDRVEEMARYATVPVVNALTDDFHPCQVLADFLTLAQHKGGVDALEGMTIAYVGDAANNMSHSYLLAGAVAGMHVRVAGPQGFLPRPDIVADAERIAAENGGSILVTTDPYEAVKDADCIFTDTWVSMGEEAQYELRSKPFWKYQVNDELMAAAKPDALFQHCLPAYRGKEVTASVIDGPQSVVWDEAENRLHAQKALLTWLIAQQRGDMSLLAGVDAQ
ncbi:ornithine carbamoyltransferase [Alloscardovia macacae]|uniref:Ornithine carbamoyltransferase n=1 Tax=Alloscardovia macacae TaxID=1160091 RepID=A0A1Y2SVG5_9BIFI|nr:ornithine carbamoyltransferase [Alloscardovia macacae]OTA26184.1 ornithine carbamoyltransferase [Alloscardovia macacae]OTA29965.1 ornithine carbamoyltransferase [Alloscardovia macacae]